METLENRIEKLKADNAKKLQSEIIKLEMQEKLLRVTGIEFMVVDYKRDGSELGAFVENNTYRGQLFDRKEIKNIIDKIQSELKLKSRNDRFGFAGKEEIPMTNNCRVSIENNINDACFGHSTIAKITFLFEGLSIGFRGHVLEMFDINNLYTESRPHPEDIHKRRNQRRKMYYSLKGFKTVNYYGGEAVTGCVQESRNEEFFNLIYNG